MDKMDKTQLSQSTTYRDRSLFNKSTQRTTRLHSLHNTQSFTRGDLGKHTLKQAGMTAVFKGIQTADIEKITGKKDERLLPQIRRGSFVYHVDEKKTDRGNIHENLVKVRKKYDAVKNQVLSLQKQMEILKEDNDMLKKREIEMGAKQKNVHVSKAYEDDCDMAKKLYENSYWQYKSYQHLKRRLKDDMVSYDIKQNTINEQLRLLDFELKQCAENAKKSQQFNHSTQLMMEKMLENIEIEQRKREDELEQFKEVYRKKQQIDRQNNDREQKQKYISEHAMHDKDLTEKKWRQLLLVHQFVNNMFKAKMDRELKKFDVVESAYQQIKQATGISDATEIVEKFLTREQTYGELLASIAEYEKRIAELNKNKEESSRKLEDLRYELNSMEQNKKNSNKGNFDSNFQKKLESVEDHTQRVELEKERIYQWCIKTMVQIEKIRWEQQQKNQNNHQEEEQEQQDQQQEQEEDQDQQQQDEEQDNQEEQQQDRKQIQRKKKDERERKNWFDEYPRDKFQELFKEVLKNLQTILENSDQDEVKQMQQQLDRNDPQQETNQQQFFERNTRILPPVRKKEKIREAKLEDHYYSQHHSQSEESDSESYIGGSTSDHENDGAKEEQEEEQYMNTLRENILREKDINHRKQKFEDSNKRQQQQQQQQMRNVDSEKACNKSNPNRSNAFI